MWACYKGRVEVARVLLENGANCNVKGEVRIGLMEEAAERSSTVLVNRATDSDCDRGFFLKSQRQSVVAKTDSTINQQPTNLGH